MGVSYNNIYFSIYFVRKFEPFKWDCILFCFILLFRYETRKEAENCIRTLQNTLLNGKNLIIDWDAGFVEGRQYSRKKKSQRPIVFYPSF